MTIQTFDEAHGARPFHPFWLAMPDGRTLSVPKPDSIAHHAGSRLAVVVNVRGGAEAVDLASVKMLQFKVEPTTQPEKGS